MTLQEVNIDCASASVIEWGMSIGSPHDRPLPPVLLFLARDIPEALRDDGLTWPTGHLSVTRDGFATATYRDGPSYIYELFPARFNDRDPYDPPCYVGRWPD